MIYGIVLLSSTLTALIAVFCILIYTRQKKQVDQIYLQQQSLLKIETVLNNAIQQQTAIQKKIDQLASDVLQRDMYQNTDDRHQAAIKSARQGMGLFEIVQRHGLSSDEAELIISLHAPAQRDGDVSIKNANLNNTTVLDVI